MIKRFRNWIVFAFERLMYRLFCGAECWQVRYRLYFDTGYYSGVHRTYKSLSKCNGRFEGVGTELAKEIASDIRFKTGIIATSCTIVSVERM